MRIDIPERTRKCIDCSKQIPAGEKCMIELAGTAYGKHRYHNICKICMAQKMYELFDKNIFTKKFMATLVAEKV